MQNNFHQLKEGIKMKSINTTELNYTNNSNACDAVIKVSNENLTAKIEKLLVNISNKLGLSYAVYQK